jgi:protein-tyrosine phosphatase
VPPLNLIRESDMSYPGSVTSSDAPSGSPAERQAAPDTPRRPAPGHHPPWLAHLLRPINRRYGTYRGLIRLWLTHLLLTFGGRTTLTGIEPRTVRRVVFVCQGNICRSPFAEVAARQVGLRASSVGLATGSNVPAFPLAVETARGFGIDLGAHRTRDIVDFRFEPGDLVLAMELRHLRPIRRALAGKPVQVSLLGLWKPQACPHIHDPHRLNAEYFRVCFEVIRASVEGLALYLRGAPACDATRT